MVCNDETVAACDLTFNDLQQGALVEGLAPEPVTIAACIPQGPGCAQIFYQDRDAQAGSAILYESDLSTLRLAADKVRWTFDADATEFKLAAEAMRIHRAGLFDPMMAVSSSNVDPFPHQIRAVYEEMLPRTELRFLLADDPGAGKTIMAGLYLNSARAISAQSGHRRRPGVGARPPEPHGPPATTRASRCPKTGRPVASKKSSTRLWPTFAVIEEPR